MTWPAYENCSFLANQDYHSFSSVPVTDHPETVGKHKTSGRHPLCERD